MAAERINRSFKKFPLAFALALAVGLFSGPGNAQWAVIDAPQMAQDWAKFLKEFNQWRTELQNWQKQYNEALTMVNNLTQNPSMMLAGYNLDMKKIPETQGENEQCPIPGTQKPELSLSSLFSALSINPDANLVKQQWQLCIVGNRLRNRKYNEIVDMVKEAKDRNKKISDLIASAKSDKTEGAWRSAMLNGQAIMESTLVDIQFMEARLKAYDEMIADTQKQSDGLARKAMDGKQSLLGTVVSTVTLEAALKTLK